MRVADGFRGLVPVVSTSVLAMVAIAFASPASGETSSLVSRIAAAVRLAPSATAAPQGTSFTGTPAVGALFTVSNGTLGQHFCTASVVHSSAGDLLITAAHCVAGQSAGSIAFVP